VTYKTQLGFEVTWEGNNSTFSTIVRVMEDDVKGFTWEVKDTDFMRFLWERVPNVHQNLVVAIVMSPLAPIRVKMVMMFQQEVVELHGKACIVPAYVRYHTNTTTQLVDIGFNYEVTSGDDHTFANLDNTDAHVGYDSGDWVIVSLHTPVVLPPLYLPTYNFGWQSSTNGGI